MPNRVFFRTKSGPVPAEEFISTQPQSYRLTLSEAARELSETATITQGRVGRIEGGDWSVWVEDELGERENFRMYLSELEESSVAAPVARPVRKLGQFEELPGRPMDNFRWRDASEIIKTRFSGPVRESLMASLNRALLGLTAGDGTIDKTADGVILRVLSRTLQVSQFEAEIELKWET